MPSGINFNFDERAFKRQVEKAANDAVAEQAKKAQRMFDSLARTHSGKPLAEVKRAVRQGWRGLGDGWDITDPDLTEYATVIAEGGAVKVQSGGLR
jgi:hypothetical protein